MVGELTTLGLAKRLGIVQGAGVDALQSILSPSGEDYAFYDFSSQNGGRLFQENVGPTPANTIGNSIGLAVGREKAGSKTLSELLATQPELANPAAGTNRSTGTGTANYSGGVITLVGTNSSNSGNYDFPFPSAAGKLYAVSFTISSAASFCGAWDNANFSGVLSGSAAGRGVGNYTIFVAALDAQSFVGFQNVGSGGTSIISDISVKEVSAHFATQSSSSLKPQFQTAGAKFDGSDDNLLTDILAQAGENCLIVQASIPATIAAFQCVAGLVSSGNDRFHIGIGTDGKLACSVGSDTSTFVGVNDLRGTDVILSLCCSGSIVRLFENATLVVEAAQSGAAATATAFRLGARNNAGTAGNFFGGTLRRASIGRKMLTLAQHQQIRSQWLAAG